MATASDIPGGGGDRSLAATAVLLQLVRDGDDTARNRLLDRYLPILSRWARGRLPGPARDLSETDDLVQITLLRALRNIEEFEYRREGAFMAYLRQILLNAIRDEARRAARRPVRLSLEENIGDLPLGNEPTEHETIELYEAALASLPETQQEAVILRVEFGWSYPEIAEAVESPSANAARMMVTRALVRIAEGMDEQGS
ncbi:RNA polymerase sigma factor [Candidatus Eisenbacteria bacterium]|uniref:RNA polymerase sigma factor n=1 Tax=Eiseniibacteriota bacterium TaxID=2212470 RepID=A0ABV6YIS4_UNCEI